VVVNYFNILTTGHQRAAETIGAEEDEVDQLSRLIRYSDEADTMYR